MQLTHDRWLIPSRQYELPGRDLVPATVLHARREWTFLVLASLFLTATIALPLFASGVVVDLGGALGLERTIELPLGFVVFPFALVIAQLVCELFGSHRIQALAVVGTLGAGAIVALALAAETATVTLAIALVTYCAVVHTTNAVVFGGTRRIMKGRHLWLRSMLGIGVAQVVGWSAFLLVVYAVGDDAATAADLAATASLFTCLVAVAVLLPLSLVRRVLAVYVRVGRTEDSAIDHSQLAAPPRRLQPAILVEEGEVYEPYVALPRPTRAGHLYTTNDMQFFAEGEALAVVVADGEVLTGD